MPKKHIYEFHKNVYYYYLNNFSEICNYLFNFFSAVTLYDKPPEIFRPITLREKHEILSCLSLKYKELICEDGTDTVFTEMKGDTVNLKHDRPGMLISSTSWTEDEDFSVLLTALQSM